MVAGGLPPASAAAARVRPPAHRLMVGLWAPQLLHLPPVGCFMKKSEMVAIIASRV